MSVRALIFDFDGLLLETEGPLFQSWRETYALHGAELSLEEWATTIGSADTLDPLDELERRTGLRLDREALQATRRARRDALQAGLPVSDGVIDLLDEAASLGLLLAVASSSPTAWVQAHLERLGLLQRFSHVSCFDGTGRPKPAPDVYLKALEALGERADHCVAFEDSHNGLLAANAAGLRCVVVPTAMTMHMDFETAELVIGDLANTSLGDIIHALEATRGG